MKQKIKYFMEFFYYHILLFLIPLFKKIEIETKKQQQIMFHKNWHNDVRGKSRAITRLSKENKKLKKFLHVMGYNMEYVNKIISNANKSKDLR